MVRVLELVDEHIGEPSLVVGEHVWSLAEKPEDEDDLVPEINDPLPPGEALVGRIDASQLTHPGGEVTPLRVVRMLDRRGGEPVGVGQERLRRHILVLRPPEEAGEGLQVAGGIAQRSEHVERELEEPGPEEEDLLRPAQDAERRRQAQFERMLAEQPVAEGVERRDTDSGVAVGHENVHPLLHLEGGFVGERESEDLLGTGSAGGDQIGDPSGKDSGLPGAGTGDDKKGPTVVREGVDLGGVEALEDPRGRRLSDGVAG